MNARVGGDRCVSQCLLRASVAAGGILVGLLVANRPRFWWQDLFHSLALYWLVPAIIAAFWLLCTMLQRRSWSWWAALGLAGYLGATIHMSLRLVPYAWNRHRDKEMNQPVIPLRGFWLESISSHEAADEVVSLIRTYSPHVVVLSGASIDRLIDRFVAESSYHTFRFTGHGDEEIAIISSFAPAGSSHYDLGFDAAPGGFVALTVGGGKTVQLGAVVLQRSFDKEHFERNRVSARRLSALVRNSSESRIVFADLRVTPFSELAAVYPEQAKVRSARTGQGIVATLVSAGYFGRRAGSDLFVSRDVRVTEFSEVTVPARERPGFFFSLEVAGLSAERVTETPFAEPGIE